MKLEAKSKLKLHELMEKRGLTQSQCGKAFLRLLAPLIEGAVLTWTRSGAGRRLVVSDPDALREFCYMRFPDVALPSGIDGRIAGVAHFRDSKAVPNTESDIVSIRAWREEGLLKGDHPAGAATATLAHGLFSFRLTKQNPYRLNGRCMLVENPTVFAAAEHIRVDVDAVVYGYGRISRRVLDWLSRTVDSNFKLLHLPDYDPVGLSEFDRVHAKLGSQVELYLPSDLEVRFERFSNRELLMKRNSQAMLARLRTSKLPAIQRVVALIDRHNAGLEQEGLLIPL